MTPAPVHEVTRLLRAWGDGDEAALDRLTPFVYDELRRLARGYMRRERQGHTLQTTALVNEAYLRLVDVAQVKWQDRAHFFAISAQMMRRILVDAARARASVKRGGQAVHVDFEKMPEVSVRPDRDVVAIDEALRALEEIDPRKAQVVELRFFAGMNVEETAEAMKISPRSVIRDWNMAKAWLIRELEK